MSEDATFPLVKRGSAAAEKSTTDELQWDIRRAFLARSLSRAAHLSSTSFLALLLPLRGLMMNAYWLTHAPLVMCL